MTPVTTTWIGESGEEYEYKTVNLPHRPPKDVKGNYIFAKQVGGIWLAVYVGEGILRQRYDAALKEECVTEKGATHYHYHTDHSQSRSARREEESDIIEGNPECKAPKGCNGTDP